MTGIDEYLRLRDRMLCGDLARQRIIAGLTRSEVGERMGIPRRAVKCIEEGLADPHLSTLRRYCLAIGVVIGWEVLVPKGDPRAVEEAPDMKGEADS